ncbi:MAG: M56 family metallopeptidase [Oscillospiraceae bacterium]|jgi:beta-lactamase regulating signal transducer with metallopeptidase domain|nr:M56 family metallopeptidase [Oscillospiraceae bacterium]MCI2205011.1 M56 family metallopeptidase [Oscillospiraceae bacterium]
MITDLFYVVLFVTAFGSIAWILIMFFQHVLKIRIPFYFCSLMLLFYILPFFNSGLNLIMQDQKWIPTFLTASKVWIIGCCISLGYLIVRSVYVYLAVCKYAPCDNKTVAHILQKSATLVKIKKLPEILYGDLKDPACVISLGHPKIILSKRISDRLTEQELTVILAHELIHIKRDHLFLQKCFDLIVCIHWFNPLIWAARHEYSISCEMDCDQSIFKSIPELSASDYANLMLKMLKLALPNKCCAASAIGTLDFMLARQRFQSILLPTSAIKKCCSIILSFAIMTAVIFGSLVGSKTYFYSTPTGSIQIERSAGHE